MFSVTLFNQVSLCFFLKEQEKKRQEEVDSLKTELSNVTTDLDKLDLEIKKFTASRQQMEEVISSEAKSAEEKSVTYNVKKRTLDLLPEAEVNIGKLQVKECFCFI